MAEIKWDGVGEKVYETGVDHGVLYLTDGEGNYDNGVAWNGLTTVTESPSGAESNKQYADNQVYVNLKSAEEFGATIEAFTSPREFDRCDGSATPHAGLSIGQQRRETFGLSYRTLKGNDTEGTDHGYKLHLVWGADANPSEKAYTTVNDSPEAMALSWELTTTAVPIEGVNPDTGKPYRPTASITIDSTTTDPEVMEAIENILYGRGAQDPRLPSPTEIIELFAAGTGGTDVTATPPAYNATTKTITIPDVTGVQYRIDGANVEPGAVVITKDTLVTARAKQGYSLSADSDDDFFYKF